VWHLERHSFQQARKYFGHLATLRLDDPDVWICLSVCCAMAEEFEECSTAVKRASNLLEPNDIRLRFCQSLMQEKKKDYPSAIDGYTSCLTECGAISDEAIHFESALESHSITISQEEIDSRRKRADFVKELGGEVMLRVAVVRKEMGNLDLSMQMCNKIAAENYNDSIRANALCLKVSLIRSYFLSPPLLAGSVARDAGRVPVL
jgi:tetratricopeptide (TPR) repeat protein